MVASLHVDFRLVSLTSGPPRRVVVTESSFDPFMDSKLFTIKWQGPLDLDRDEVDLLGDRHVMITTNHMEHYRCILPETLRTSESDALTYAGPSADELLRPFFQENRCSYRIESYWTYELCHGRHLRQYHETKEQGKEPKVQEYYLGMGNHREHMQDAGHIPAEVGASVPKRFVDGIELPYYEVIMDGGTRCDLTGKPRKAHVNYVCQPEGMGEIFELKESSTCEYEVVVLASYLCNHPTYRPKTQPVNEIKCHAMLGSPLKPRELTQTEMESRYLQDSGQDYFMQLSSSEATSTKRKPRFIRKGPDTANANAQQEQQSQLGAVTDKQTLRTFLSGSQCLTGGAGWWRHELCFQSLVKQFHNEKGRDANIFLGYWNKEKHIQWLRDNPHKQPRPADVRKHVSLLYSDGDVCDLTGKPRSCEVKLKCLENPKTPHAIVLSLEEPEPCQYALTVESALFCPILKDADENGLFDHIEL
ncbi:hypothetical protein BsWGS_14572 [Bradybaena similaris]